MPGSNQAVVPSSHCLASGYTVFDALKGPWGSVAQSFVCLCVLLVRAFVTPKPDCRRFSPAVSWSHEPGLPRDDLPLPFCPDPVRAKEVARDWTADRAG